MYTGAQPWTAQVFKRDSGAQLGMAKFRPTTTVYDGTSEELAQRPIAMLEGTRTVRQTTNRGVASHLVRNIRHVDLYALRTSVALNVTNTNSAAFSPVQTFITYGRVVATTPCHRDEYDALLAQLWGSTELLMHPPALSIPGCPADVYGDAAVTGSSRWLWPFDPFQLPCSDSSLWVKVMMVPGDVVVVPKGWWHAVRSTPSSVAISVAVQLETVDERTVRRRTCRRDAQPAPVERGASDAPLGNEQTSNS